MNPSLHGFNTPEKGWTVADYKPSVPYTEQRVDQHLVLYVSNADGSVVGARIEDIVTRTG